jgi:hypothetical protein
LRKNNTNHTCGKILLRPNLPGLPYVADAPADAHHLRFAQSPALGRKVSDEFTVPLCRGHHREVHRYGDEAAWWEKTGSIDPTAAARLFWLKTHPLPIAIGAV